MQLNRLVLKVNKTLYLLEHTGEVYIIKNKWKIENECLKYLNI